ncbi:MAG: hypothetical protein DME21_13820 [Verrucomicrobia bacterium]|nr:MAG: hypothetical protein DME21_13820 [Verrucomicrobiota bacterium]
MDPKNFLGSVGESITGLFGKKSKLAALAPPHLHSGVRFPYGPFQFKFQIPKGASYEIQVSSNLQNWQAVSAGKSGGEPVDYVDSEASKFSYRFYRLLAEAIFSDNVVGYVTINVPPGYSMIANPLQAPPNTVSSILPDAPEGTTINKFDTRLFKLTENAVMDGKWININFTGEVMQGNLLLPIAAGFSVRSSQIPKPGRLHSDLGFPISEGDVIHLFDRDRQNYVIYEYDPKKWDSNPPIVGVGEAFWIGKTKPGNWVQNLIIK